MSVVIPAWNGAPFLADAIDSALAQTHPNVEIVVINDGSNDGGRTDWIARCYGGRIVYIAQENRGVAGALNAGIARMRGDFFAYLSQDDIFQPNKLESQLDFHRLYGSPDTILLSDYDKISETGDIVEEACLSPNWTSRSPLLSLLRGELSGSSLLIPKRLLEAIGPLDQERRYSYGLWYEILSKNDFLVQPEALVKRRVHAGQAGRRPEMIREASELWRALLEERSEVERFQLAGSSKRFFAEMAEFLRTTPFEEAYRYAVERRDAALDDTLASIVLPVTADAAATAESARSVLAQSHDRLELLLTPEGVDSALLEVAAELADDARVRSVRPFADDRLSSWQAAIEAAAGDYIGFINTGTSFLPTKVARQIKAMQETGRPVSLTGTAGSGTDLVPCGAVPIATVMMHRSLGASAPPVLAGASDALERVSWVALSGGEPAANLSEQLTAEPSSAPKGPRRIGGGPLTILQKLLADAMTEPAFKLHTLGETLETYLLRHEKTLEHSQRGAPSGEAITHVGIEPHRPADGDGRHRLTQTSGSAKPNQGPRPAILIADFDMYSVVGGGQVLLRSLLLRNPAMDFFYFSRGPDLALKEVGELPPNVYPLPIVEADRAAPFAEIPSVDTWSSHAYLAVQMAISCIGRHFDAVDIPSYIPLGGFLRDAFDLFGVTADRFILSLHGWVTVGAGNQYHSDDLREALKQWDDLEHTTFDVCQTAFTVSDDHSAETMSRFNRPATVIDMHNVLNAPEVGMEPLPPKPDLWFVGRLDRNKGPDLFVEIVAELDKSLYGQVHVAGPDLTLPNGRTCWEIMADQAAALGIAVQYEGELKKAELRERVFNGRNIVIIPSRADTFNLVALEAVTSGTPVLLSTAAGALAFLDHHHPRIPVMRMSPDDPASAAAELREFLGSYPQTAQAFRRAVADEAWPTYEPNFMRSIYLEDRREGAREARGLEGRHPYVALQPDPRRRCPPRNWTMQDPLLTIVVPTYKRPKWLINCLASIAQEKPERTEVLVIDDGSPAEMDIGKIVSAYAPYARVISTENRGEARAVNLGITEANTPYVMVLSDDDVINGDWPGRAIELLEATGAVLVYPDWAIIDSAGTILEEYRLPGCSLERIVCSHWCLPGPGTIFRRNDALAVGCRSRQYRWVSDYDLWLKLFGRGNFEHVPGVSAYWRHHESNATHATGLPFAAEHIEVISQDIQRRGEADRALTLPLAKQALAVAHLAAAVILMQSTDKQASHAHFLMAYLLSPRTVADLPENITVYASFYPAWLRDLLEEEIDEDAANWPANGVLIALGVCAHARASLPEDGRAWPALAWLDAVA